MSIVVTPLDSAAHLLKWSNVLYVSGAALTLVAAMYLLYENQAIAAGKRAKYYLVSEVFASIAAVVSLVGTIGAIHFADKVSSLKDADLQAYEKQADLQIAQARFDTAIANSQAAIARQKAEEARQKVSELEAQGKLLSGNIDTNANEARTKETALEKANRDTNDFAHALAKQQAIMADQAKVSPQLAPEQISLLKASLTRFAGRSVSVHATADTVVLRLAQAIVVGLNQAGVLTPDYSIDHGQLYQGVSVAVHSPDDVPPIADALVTSLHQLGIQVHTVSLPQEVAPGQVWLILGPN